MYLTGECVNVGQFSKDMVSLMIKDYVKNAKDLNNWCWAKIMTTIGAAQIDESEHPMLSAPFMEQKDLLCLKQPCFGEIGIVLI